MKRSEKKYRILALDGGGIRGLLTAILLERLEKAVPGWLDRVDFLAGTSTGGILALGLAHGVSPSRLRELYEREGPRDFRRFLARQRARHRAAGGRGVLQPPTDP